MKKGNRKSCCKGRQQRCLSLWLKTLKTENRKLKTETQTKKAERSIARLLGLTLVVSTIEELLVLIFG